MSLMLISWIGCGLVADLILGDPPTWPHPVKLIGKLIALFTKWFNRENYSDKAKQWLGAVMWLAVIGITAGVTALIMWAVWDYDWLRFIVVSYLCYTCLSVKGLAIESHKIMKSLKQGDLIKARYQVGMIVGRDTVQLTDEEVCKATIETVAENTCDGVIAPMMFLFIGGPVLGLTYKAVNTLDSMVGYQNEKYRAIGRVSAIIDDVFNYIPARLSWLFLVLSTMLLRFDTRQAVSVGFRDREHHKSPNSGFSEAVVAGALSLRLGGPHNYFGQRVDKPYIGNANGNPADVGAIASTLRLLYVVAVLSFLIFTFIWIGVYQLGGYFF